LLIWHNPYYITTPLSYTIHKIPYYTEIRRGLFLWLADSLAAIAESLGWNKKEDKKEELAGRIIKRFPVSFHIFKIRRSILKTIGKRKRNEEKVKDIFVVVPKRGVMLKLKAEEIKIN